MKQIRQGHGDPTPGPWTVDKERVVCPSDMANNLLDFEGTEGEWVAVGIEDSDGYAESVAYCHPDNAPLIAASHDLADAAQEALSFLKDLGHGHGAPAERLKAALAKAGLPPAPGHGQGDIADEGDNSEAPR